MLNSGTGSPDIAGYHVIASVIPCNAGRAGLLPPSLFELRRDAVSRRGRRKAPRNDGLRCFRQPLNFIASGAKQSSAAREDWIASAFALRASVDAVVARARNEEIERFHPLQRKWRREIIAAPFEKLKAQSAQNLQLRTCRSQLADQNLQLRT
jgi:hypothetical protein